jgi:hypothetical protein
LLTLNVIDINHAFALVGVAFPARRNTRATANAARRIKKDLLYQLCHMLLLLY